jgi:hypothetical protein
VKRKVLAYFKVLYQIIPRVTAKERVYGPRRMKPETAQELIHMAQIKS